MEETYEEPQVEDLGTLGSITQGAGQLGAEDGGGGKFFSAGVDGLAVISGALLPSN